MRKALSSGSCLEGAIGSQGHAEQGEAKRGDPEVDRSSLADAPSEALRMWKTWRKGNMNAGECG